MSDFQTNVSMEAGHEKETTGAVFAWGLGASLAAGAATAILGGGFVGFGIATGVGAALATGYGLAMAVYDDLKTRALSNTLREQIKAHGALNVARTRDKNKLDQTRTIEPTATGRYPLLQEDRKSVV